MIQYLLDTDTCVFLIRGRAETVVRHLKERLFGTLAISAITLAELRFGVAKSMDPAREILVVARFLTPLIILPFNQWAAASYGPLRASLERSGTPIGPLDTLIAAHAISLNLTLVTNNEREFRRIPNLKIENWTRP